MTKTASFFTNIVRYSTNYKPNTNLFIFLIMTPQKIFFAIISALMLISCTKSNPTPIQKQPTSSGKAHIEVLYFYGNQRCITCNAIEQLTDKVVNSHFTQQLADSTIMLRYIDFSTPEGAAIAEQYEVTWSSLFVNKVYDNHEDINNITQFAFANARKNPKKFKQGLIDQINKLLTSQQ